MSRRKGESQYDSVRQKIALVVPDRVYEAFPVIAHILNQLDIEHYKPPSGFSAGVRDIREWENTVRCGLWERTADVTLSKGPEVAEWINTRKGRPRIEAWAANLKDKLRFASPDFEFRQSLIE